MAIAGSRTPNYPERARFPNRAGWRRGKGEGQVWMVLPEVWRVGSLRRP